MSKDILKDRGNGKKMTFHPTEITPSIACRYPKKRNLISLTSKKNLRIILISFPLILLIILLFIPLTLLPGEDTNPKMFYSDEAGIYCVSALVQTVDGGYAIAGSKFQGAGGPDFWLMKTNAMGVPQWNKTYGGIKHDELSTLILTADGGFAIAGTTESYGAGGADFWLVKTNATGVPLWNQTYGGIKHDKLSALVQTVDGGFALAGQTYSFRSDSTDMWLVKTDANGVVEWNQTYGEIEQRNAYTLIQTTNKGFILASSYRLVKTNTNGVVVWNKTFEKVAGGGYTSSLIKTADEGFVFTGTDALVFYPPGQSDIWLVKIDEDGVTQWNQTYRVSVYDDIPNALVQTIDGNFVFVGTSWCLSFGMTDICLIKTDTNGVVQWNQTYGGIERDEASALVQTMDGGFAFVGTIRIISGDMSEHWGDILLVKTDVNGVIQWIQIFGKAGLETNRQTISGLETLPLLATLLVLAVKERSKHEREK
jgi:regulation of enolase protein 1 (concanavalin A-like superfamily)